MGEPEWEPPCLAPPGFSPSKAVLSCPFAPCRFAQESERDKASYQEGREGGGCIPVSGKSRGKSLAPGPSGAASVLQESTSEHRQTALTSPLTTTLGPRLSFLCQFSWVLRGGRGLWVGLEHIPFRIAGPGLPAPAWDSCSVCLHPPVGRPRAVQEGKCCLHRSFHPVWSRSALHPNGGFCPPAPMPSLEEPAASQVRAANIPPQLLSLLRKSTAVQVNHWQSQDLWPSRQREGSGVEGEAFCLPPLELWGHSRH